MNINAHLHLKQPFKYLSNFLQRRSVFCISITLLMLNISQAQSQSFLGLSGGADIYEQVDFRVAGVFESERSNWFSWQTELVYVKRENIGLLQYLPNDREYIRPIVSYLAIPLLAKIKMDISGANLYALVGPQFSLATATYASVWLENGQLLNKTFLLKDLGLTQWDFGANLGIGIEKVISKDRKIFIEFRYYLGIIDLANKQEYPIYNEGKSFNLGFLLPI